MSVFASIISINLALPSKREKQRDENHAFSQAETVVRIFLSQKHLASRANSKVGHVLPGAFSLP
jgi:hypothetical protein